METGIDVVRQLRSDYNMDDIEKSFLSDEDIINETSDEMNKWLCKFDKEELYTVDRVRSNMPWSYFVNRYNMLHSFKNNSLEKAYIVALPRFDLNSKVTKAQNGDHVIIIDFLLLTALRAFAEIVQTLLAAYVDKSGSLSKHKNFDELFDAAYQDYCQLLKYYKFKDMKYMQKVSFDGLKNTDSDCAIHIKEVSGIIGVMAFFILCHEQAHVQLGHVKAMLSAGFQSIDEYSNTKQKQEYEADREGFNLLWSCAEKKSKEAIKANIFSSPSDVVLLFLVLDRIETHCNNDKKDKVRTHPLALKRIECLRSNFEDILIPNKGIEARLYLVEKLLSILSEKVDEEKILLEV